MKVLIFVLLFTMAATVARADYLACDLQANIVASEVDVDGSVVIGIAVVQGQNLLLLDVSGLSSGPHTFKARLQDVSGWWGPWSVNPLDASRPAGADLRIVE